MKEYVLPCEAIIDLPFFSGTPDITRWDLFCTVEHGDVDQGEIDNAAEYPLTIPNSIQRRHILWAMSRRPENISLDAGTLDRVNEVNKKIVETYHSETLPIVHPGFKEVIIRLAASLAATLHSVDETHENVIVRPVHVDGVYSILEAVYNQNLELDKYAAEEKSKTTLTDSDLQEIIGVLDATDHAMLRELRKGALQSGVMAEKLSVDDSTVRKHAATLKARELVRASRGRAGGYELAPKGIRVIRKLMPREAPKDPPPSGTVNPLTNVTYSTQIVTKTPPFTDYKGAPSPRNMGRERGVDSENVNALRNVTVPPERVTTHPSTLTSSPGKLQPPFSERGECSGCHEHDVPLRPDHQDAYLVCGSCYDSALPVRDRSA